MTYQLTIIGGSAVSTVQLIEALAEWPGPAGRRPAALTLTLHGRSAERTEAVAAACRVRAADRALPLTVRYAGDLANALAGADAVLIQVRIGGLEARAWDEAFPREHGVPGEETLGPGGLASAVRTVPGLRPFWQAIAEHAPDALIINLTNPAGVVQQAARAEFGLPVVSVCDSPLTLLAGVAQSLGCSPDVVRGRYAGMNHVGWYVPADAGELDCCSPAGDGLARLYRAIPVPYLRFYSRPREVLAGQLGRPSRAQNLMAQQAQTMASYQAGSVPATWERTAPWYRLGVVPLIDAWVNGSSPVLIAGLPNDGRVPWLPDDVIVEGPVRATQPGLLEPLPVAELPDLPRGILAAHAAYERLAVAAAAQLTGESLTRAMVANPMVGDIEQASALAAAVQEHEGRAG